jgi:CTP synthase
VEDSTREKISVFCHVAPSNVLSVHDVSNIYHVPVILAEQKLPQILRYAHSIRVFSYLAQNLAHGAFVCRTLIEVGATRTTLLLLSHSTRQ